MFLYSFELFNQEILLKNTIQRVFSLLFTEILN